MITIDDSDRRNRPLHLAFDDGQAQPASIKVIGVGGGGGNGGREAGGNGDKR